MFCAAPPGDWIATKLFLSEEGGEVFLNLNRARVVAEFSAKDSDYAESVLRELAKVFLPSSSESKESPQANSRLLKAMIPVSPDGLGGPFVAAGSDTFEVLASRDKAVLVEFHDLSAEIRWFKEFQLMFCQRQHDPDTIKVIRQATDDERRRFRVPLWIQSDEIPDCCGRPMQFVGQIDDDAICAERPGDAKLWWHDAASFYVFTCSQCLVCKAVGQQF
jgi:hypothetical protein